MLNLQRITTVFVLGANLILAAASVVDTPLPLRHGQGATPSTAVTQSTREAGAVEDSYLATRYHQRNRTMRFFARATG